MGTGTNYALSVIGACPFNFRTFGLCKIKRFLYIGHHRTKKKSPLPTNFLSSSEQALSGTLYIVAHKKYKIDSQKQIRFN